MKLYLASYDLGGVPTNLADLIGGDQSVAIIANANDGLPQDQRAAGLANEIARLRAIDLHSEELDLRRYFDHTKSLEDDLGAYGAIWAMGGNAFVLRRAMRYSALDVLLPNLLRESRLTYGGYSAGAVVAGPTLHGIDLVDDPHEVPPSYQGNVVWSGLDLVPYRIAPHYRSRDRQTFQIELVVNYFVAHNAKYRTLSDGQAIVINGQSEQFLDFRAPELRRLENTDPSEWLTAPRDRDS